MLEMIFYFVPISNLGSPFVLSKHYTLTSPADCFNSTTGTFSNTTHLSPVQKVFFESPCLNYTSIIVLLSAMALSRFGLWLNDLVIHQIIQESVNEKERGIIGGTQNSLNKIFDLIKYVCVILLSDVSQYGYLVIISVSAVSTACFLLIIYAVIKSVSHSYAEVPVVEDRPVIDKSMIKVVRNEPEQIDQNDNGEDSDDSFNEEKVVVNNDYINNNAVKEI